MKLVTYSEPADGDDVVTSIGAVLDGAVVDLSEIAPDMRTFFAAGEPALEQARERLGRPQAVRGLEEVRLRPPIVPKKFFHTAGNFREHEEESKRVNFSHPIKPWIVFFQNTDALIGPDDAIVYPDHLTSELDYELELAVVLAQDGKHFGAGEALDYVGGYVVFNDITARDIQREEMESGVFSFCKAIDTFCPLGPWIVTPDEVPDVHDLAMRLRVNGEERQTSNTGRMDFSLPEIIAHYSPLGYSAGDVLSTGTVSGIAGFSEDPEAWYLRPGDVIEAEIEHVGTLRNPVVSWEQAYGHRAPAVA